MSISAENLPQFLLPRVEYGLRQAHVPNGEISVYITGALCRFVRTEDMYSPTRDPDWQTGYISDMMKAVRETSDKYRQLIVYQHVGDFTLIHLGIFPEHVEKRGLESLYHDGGKLSYGTASKLETSNVSGLFSELAERFEPCVTGLNIMRDRRLHLGPDTVNTSVRRSIESLAGIDDLK